MKVKFLHYTQASVLLAPLYEGLFCLIICRQNIFRLLVAYSIFLCLSVLPGNYYLVMLGEGIANAKLCFFNFLKNKSVQVFFHLTPCS